jgi:hypothetical protein
MAIRGCWRRLLAAPGSWCLDEDERGIVVEWRAGMPQQIGTQAFKQVWVDAAGAGRGQLGEAAGQGVAPVAGIAGLGHTIGVEQQRVAGPQWQRPRRAAAIA